MINNIPAAKVDTFNRYLGFKQYELSNHIDNVLAVVTDRKIPRPDGTLAQVDHYEADILSSNDYYPFGMYEPGRNFNSSAYRYKFNGKDKSTEKNLQISLFYSIFGT